VRSCTALQDGRPRRKDTVGRAGNIGINIINIAIAVVTAVTAVATTSISIMANVL
jgi:hypothetical protein